MNSESINIREYQAWRTAQKRTFEQEYSAWQQEFLAGHIGVRAPRKPDWSLQAYVEHLIESRPNQRH